MELTIQRGEEVLEVAIVRELINVASVDKAEMVDREYGIGYVQLTNFSERTYDEMVAALAELDQQGMRALIIDLRNNPGGTLNAALRVADLFVAEGPLLYLEDRFGNRLPFPAVRRVTAVPCPWLF